MSRSGITVRDSQPIPVATESLGKAAIFVAVVRRGSFAKAAAELGMARSTVSQHVGSLEEHLGVRLVERTTRKLRLTDEGELLYERMSAALDAWDDALACFDERRTEPSGTLRVTTASGIASSLVGPVLSEMARDHSLLSVELISDDRVHDLIGERIDVAVRMAQLGDSRLVARKLTDDRLVFVAAPSLAASLGDDLDALSACAWTSHTSVPRGSVEVYERGTSRAITVQPRYRGSASTTEAQLSLTVGGVGIALVPSLLAAPKLTTGELVQVFCRFEAHRLPIYALYPARGRLPARTRSFIDRLVERMQSASE